MLHVFIYCQLAWYLNTVSIFGKLRVWNLTTVGTSSYMLLGLVLSKHCVGMHVKYVLSKQLDVWNVYTSYCLGNNYHNIYALL